MQQDVGKAGERACRFLAAHGFSLLPPAFEALQQRLPPGEFGFRRGFVQHLGQVRLGFHVTEKIIPQIAHLGLKSESARSGPQGIAPVPGD